MQELHFNHSHTTNVSGFGLQQIKQQEFVFGAMPARTKAKKRFVSNYPCILPYVR